MNSTSFLGAQVDDIADGLIKECTSNMPDVIATNDNLSSFLTGARLSSACIESLEAHAITCGVVDQLPGLVLKKRFQCSCKCSACFFIEEAAHARIS